MSSLESPDPGNPYQNPAPGGVPAAEESTTQWHGGESSFSRRSKGLRRPLRSKPPLIVIVGPTAVGKTAISIQLAERLQGEIVSADSRLFYRGMDIGTAKPTLEERRGVPHHLIDVADPCEIWSLALFQQAAAEAIAGIHARQHLPILVGGTGQYIHAVAHGWNPPTTKPDMLLRAELEARARSKGYQALFEELQELDPAAAEKIDPRNVRRTIRALEVIRLTGRKFSEQRRQVESPYHLLTIGLSRPRPEIYARVDARIETMFSAGLLDEVQHLIDFRLFAGSAYHVSHRVPGSRWCSGRPLEYGTGQNRDAPPDAHLRPQAG